MKIVIEIPSEFETHFEQDRFEDSLHRLSADAHLLAGNYEQEVLTMLIKAFKDCSVIEVSEDAPPAQPNIEYILSQLADLLDEYAELDEHGLHDPKWCGVNEAYLIVKNASSKQKEGEWIIHKINGIPHTVECSHCHQHYDYEELRHLGRSKGCIDIPHCPNCGEKMKGAKK